MPQTENSVSLADRPDRRTRFLLTGSASPDIARAASESLAGRVRLLELGGFTDEETGLKQLFVIYPGDKDYLLADRIEVVRFQNLSRCLDVLDSK